MLSDFLVTVAEKKS